MIKSSSWEQINTRRLAKSASRAVLGTDRSVRFINSTIGNDSSVDWTSCSSVELLRLSKLSMVSRNEAMCLKERTKVHRNAKVNCRSIVSLERQYNFHHHE